MKERDKEDVVLNKAFRERYLQWLLRHEHTLLLVALLFGVLFDEMVRRFVWP